MLLYQIEDEIRIPKERRKMIKYICKKCNINTETSVCPVCGERAEMESSSIYWCDTCNIPLYDEICPMCGKKAHRIGADLRPVFPEERLLLEIMIGEPFKYKNSSVWNAAGNYYYVDGKKLTFSVKQTKLLNAKMIRKQLDELSDQNSYDFFDKNIGKEVVKEFLLNPNAMYLEAEEIYKKYQK